MSGTTHSAPPPRDASSHDGDRSGPTGGGGNVEGTPIAHSRCVLWLHPSEVVPKPLLKSLSKRIERTIFATDSYQALAEVLALGQEGKREGRVCPIVLLLIKPLRLSDADQVLHALDMYAPRTRRWRFDPSATPVFAPMSEEDVARLSRAGASDSESQSISRGQIVVSPDAGESLGLSRGDRPSSLAGPRPFSHGRTERESERRGPGGSGGSSVGSGSGRGSDRTRAAPTPSPKPRLRLVEADAMADTIVGTPLDDGLPGGPSSSSGSRDKSGGGLSGSSTTSGGVGGAPAGGRTSFSQLTPEELQMLLSDPPSSGGPGSSPGGSPSNPPPRR